MVQVMRRMDVVFDGAFKGVGDKKVVVEKVIDEEASGNHGRMRLAGVKWFKVRVDIRWVLKNLRNLIGLGGTLGNNNDGLNVSPTGIALHVPFATLESVFVVNKRLNNTVYGFFLGKRVAFPIVENYVKNTWRKFHLVKSMMIKDMFFFKFRSKDRMEPMLENGPLLIHNVTLILKRWTPDGNIMKEDVCNVAMCTDSWSRVSYVNAMVELQADVELKDIIMVDAPKFVGDGYTMSTIRNLKKPTQAIRGISVGSNPKSNFIYRPVQPTKKTDKAPGKPKVTKATNTTTSTLNSFDALNTFVDEDDCGCMNPSSIQEAEQVEGNGKKDVEVDYNGIAQFMANGGANDENLYEDEDYDIYDNYDIKGLTKLELAFCDMIDINLRGLFMNQM
ncbi:U5 small nuclear ribonucleoprotein helicase [Tanacetum coccineum]